MVAIVFQVHCSSDSTLLYAPPPPPSASWCIWWRLVNPQRLLAVPFTIPKNARLLVSPAEKEGGLHWAGGRRGGGPRWKAATVGMAKVEGDGRRIEAEVGGRKRWEGAMVGGGGATRMIEASETEDLPLWRPLLWPAGRYRSPPMCLCTPPAPCAASSPRRSHEGFYLPQPRPTPFQTHLMPPPQSNV